MSFRREKKDIEQQREWAAFHQDNAELIERIGLPLAAVETLEHFQYLLMHGCLEYSQDPTRFSLDDLQPDQLALFRRLIKKFYEAGFRDPGVGPWLIGGDAEYRKLVQKYPEQFGEHKFRQANE